jgi:hypothetical protein
MQIIRYETYLLSDIIIERRQNAISQQCAIFRHKQISTAIDVDQHTEQNNNIQI